MRRGRSYVRITQTPKDTEVVILWEEAKENSKGVLRERVVVGRRLMV